MSDVKSPGTIDEKALFEKFIKQITDNSVAKADTRGGHGGVVVTEGYLYNSNREDNKELHIIDEHHWSGELDPEFPFPPSLEWRPLGPISPITPFKHRARIPEGSVAGVVYADGQRQWLVAFDMSNQKIYAEAGPISTVDWCEVKVKLDQSTDSSRHEDPIFGGIAYAHFYLEGVNSVYALFYR
ncbi:hypothetical protein RND81_09G111400 [Saponaria officinalis]|uniref:Uncharacterized protein n=1 Tax=Saponaria officinalis TaxID=3572 RepID=A0AAW1ILJ1_SAPOF